MTCTITTGYNHIDFSVSSTELITKEMAFEIQTQNGYHPFGYGFYNLEIKAVEPNLYTAKWWCSKNSD